MASVLPSGDSAAAMFVPSRIVTSKPVSGGRRSGRSAEGVSPSRQSAGTEAAHALVKVRTDMAAPRWAGRAAREELNRTARRPAGNGFAPRASGEARSGRAPGGALRTPTAAPRLGSSLATGWKP